MTNIGFVKAQSDNLPRIDAFMMSSYFASNLDFTSAEVKGVKAVRSERESYGDSAIGYVQVKRDGDGICVVKARITPEHNVRQKCYAVTAICHENEEKIVNVSCEDCAAHLGCLNGGAQSRPIAGESGRELVSRLEALYSQLPLATPADNPLARQLYGEWLHGRDSDKAQATLHTTYHAVEKSDVALNIKW